MGTLIQLALFPLPPINFSRSVLLAPRIPQQMSFEEWIIKNRDIEHSGTVYTMYINKLHTEQILWVRWCGHAK